MKEIYDSFVVETRELLDVLSGDLMLLEQQPDDLDLLNRIFRCVHTIKGTAGFMGFENIQTITHKGEDLLNKLRKSELQVNQDVIDVLLEVYDWVVLLMENIESGDNATVDFGVTAGKIAAILQGGGVNAVSGASSAPVHVASSDAIGSIINNPEFGKSDGDTFSDDEEAALQAAFAQINSGFSVSSALSATADQTTPSTAQPQQPKADFKAPVAADRPVETKSASPQKSEPVAKQAPAADTTIRVDVGRVETLMNLSGELVLGRNRLQQIASKLHEVFDNNDLVRDLLETAEQVDYITSEIQTSVMRMRMVPISKLFQKAPRIVRDISREIGKEIELELTGEETELDRTIIEELNDPLVHMIRNACDHGIEPPQERLDSGKLRKGKVQLSAEQEGNNIIIRIKDDGKGMDPEKLKAKALEKGVITPEQAANMSDREAFHLIFAPGFSTAQTVSNISGRGVGMDVVRTNIQKLKGVVDIDSVKGRGSIFTIKLPLTLAIIQGLLVKVHNETYTVPLGSVVEVVGVDCDHIHTVNQKPVVRIREKVLPLLELGTTLGTAAGNDNKQFANKYIVVVGIGETSVGLVVDELLGQQEIVIKSLGSYLGHIHGITGSTILGDGTVVMIVDVPELMDGIRNTYSERSEVLV
ncbi:MAG: chemotaxis protein CheA [Candidatus Kapabacteria bacterium]|nr:chemotaxis protein CheA [Candidatus Kapabacteria bacterium]